MQHLLGTKLGTGNVDTLSEGKSLSQHVPAWPEPGLKEETSEPHALPLMKGQSIHLRQGRGVQGRYGRHRPLADEIPLPEAGPYSRHQTTARSFSDPQPRSTSFSLSFQWPHTFPCVGQRPGHIMKRGPGPSAPHTLKPFGSEQSSVTRRGYVRK